MIEEVSRPQETVPAAWDIHRLAVGERFGSVIMSDSWKLRSLFVENVVRPLSPPLPLSDLGAHIRACERQPESAAAFPLAAAIPYATRIGLPIDPAAPRHRNFVHAFQTAMDRGGRVSGSTLRKLLDWVAATSGRPRLNALDALGLYGLTITPPMRHPVCFVARPGMSNNHLLRDLADDLELPRTPVLTRTTHERVAWALSRLPVFILLQDADLLESGVLQLLVHLCWDTQTPIALFGPLGFARHLSDAAELEWVGSRILHHATISPPSDDDLAECFPGWGAKIRARMWARAHQNLDVMVAIDEELQTLTAIARMKTPGFTPSVRDVDVAADRLRR